MSFALLAEVFLNEVVVEGISSRGSLLVANASSISETPKVGASDEFSPIKAPVLISRGITGPLEALIENSLHVLFGETFGGGKYPRDVLVEAFGD
jgi:hypothetical protein